MAFHRPEDPLSEAAIQEAAQHVVLTRETINLQWPTQAVDLGAGHAISDDEDHDQISAHTSEPVREPQPQRLPLQEPDNLPRCSPLLRRAYVHRQGVTPARSAPTRTDYSITHGFPIAGPRFPTLDLNEEPSGPAAAQMEVDDDTSIVERSEGDEVEQQLGDPRITQQP
ncbi:hypothetical protein R1sor_005566 [Riccia sorocarpa]|uniref:Uncharacterized protein n=1 Tax=Riccia sorocarpa TaxID=122646 RepID=A0ABD3HNT0_9MARC